jgi:RNA polymerase sigma-70 factor (ECF subfamily)
LFRQVVSSGIEMKLRGRKETPVNSDSATTATIPLDSDVIKRAQQGDSDAFAALFNAHKARIYSVCLRMTNNAAEAEDLTQDAFLQVFRKIATFRGDSAFSTWLHRIAVNTVLMHFRKRSLCQVSLDEPYSNSDGAKIRREYGTKDSRLAGCIDRMTLALVIRELPHGYRTIFLLHEVEGYEHQEIAEMLGCSVGNSKSQLHKAKVRIRELLALSPEARFATAPEERPRTKHARPLFEKWDPSIGQGVAMQPASNMPQLTGPAA